MSHRTDRYVLDILERDPSLTTGERSVLMATSMRANIRTSTTYTGEWLRHATGLTRSSIWRALTVLSQRGYVYVDHRAGRASVVAFPIQGFVHGVEAPPGPGRVDDGGQFHPSICGCDWCQEQTG